MASASLNESSSPVSGFAPIASPAARLLILGSMPGAASLRAERYYAHPHNQFWPIMAELLGFDPALPYPARCVELSKAGIALWDVLRSCVRPGSLDSAIQARTAQANDFAAFLAEHSHIRRIAFNGAAAENLFRRYVSPQLQTFTLDFMRLPSTSPAHASLSRSAKLAAWRSGLEGQF